GVSGEQPRAGILAVLAIIRTRRDRALDDARDDVVGDLLVEVADGEITNRLEVILEGGIPVRSHLREQAGIVHRERLVGLADRFVGLRIAERGPAKARRPAQPRFQVLRDIVREVYARE